MVYLRYFDSQNFKVVDFFSWPLAYRGFVASWRSTSTATGIQGRPTRHPRDLYPGREEM